MMRNGVVASMHPVKSLAVTADHRAQGRAPAKGPPDSRRNKKRSRMRSPTHSVTAYHSVSRLTRQNDRENRDLPTGGASASRCRTSGRKRARSDRRHDAADIAQDLMKSINVSVWCGRQIGTQARSLRATMPMGKSESRCTHVRYYELEFTQDRIATVRQEERNLDRDAGKVDTS